MSFTVKSSEAASESYGRRFCIRKGSSCKVHLREKKEKKADNVITNPDIELNTQNSARRLSNEERDDSSDESNYPNLGTVKAEGETSLESSAHAVEETSTIEQNQLSDLIETRLNSASAELNEVVEDFSKCVNSDIKSIIENGNREIYSFIVGLFDFARENVRKAVDEITKNKNRNIISGKNKDNEAILSIATKRLSQAESTVLSEIASEQEKICNEVSNALVQANQSVLEQISRMLYEKNRESAILPEITFADPKLIEALFSPDRYLAQIDTMFKSTVTEIKKYEEERSEYDLKSQLAYNEKAYKDIIDVIDCTKQGILTEIERYIKSITNEEVSKISSLIKNDSEDLLLEIKRFLHELDLELKSMVKKNAGKEKTALFGLYTRSFNGVENNMNVILTTSE